MTSMTARVDDLPLARVLGMIETPLRLDGITSLTLRAEGPVSEWRSGAADLEVTRLDAMAGDLPVRLLGPASVRYRGWAHRDRSTRGGGRRDPRLGIR